ncbi:protein PTHB1 isoform X2 [Pararge aegeria]|uniref:protein PTHB1 isoform X2 n=1 Tax=Pararge aegeria TaxID=116150 RepID=UPI0019CFF799|nr:protein PTHB1 isoform X2 [Pararge aegeria]
MSIFKVKQWWSNEKSQSEEYEDGIQNENCIIVDKFNSHNDSDLIILGQSCILKIYKPRVDQNESHTILESRLDDIVLQIKTGKFSANCADRQILILHPNSYAIYELDKQGGHSDVGDQNFIAPVIKHSFTRRAHSTTCGPFGNSKSRDLICIQALDGTLSLFDQDTFLFMCIFNDIIIPGPISYVAYSDLFIICKSTWILEIYSYQQLCEFSELSIRQNKNNTRIPQWTYNAGEEIMSMQVIRTSTNFASIVALGERHLYCFQDNGLMKYMIRFDFIPICFHAYLIGWYYEPNSRLLVMVASEDFKLYLYEATTLLWSCDLAHKAISLSRCFLSSLSGGLLTLSTNGIVNVSYLGTEPNLNPNAIPINEVFDPKQVQVELEMVEDSLQKVLDAKEALNEDTEDIIKIKVDCGKPSKNLALQLTFENSFTPLQTCSVIVIITCEDPKLVQSLQITYDCIPPLSSSETTICLDNINGTEIIETSVFLSGDTDIPDIGINIKFTVIDNMGKVRVLSERQIIPLNLYCFPLEAVEENSYQMTIETNQRKIDLIEIFTDFNKEELEGFISKDMLTFAYRTSHKTVTIKAYDHMYRIEANEVSEIAPILDHFLHKLEDYYNRIGLTEFEIKVAINGEIIRQIMHKFLKSVESHAKERIKLKELEEELNVLQRQFTLVQKRLLVQYGSLPPSDCDPLEFLMNDTHERIKTVAYEIIQSKTCVVSAGNTLRMIGSLIIHVLKEAVTDNLKVKLIEEMLSLETLNGHFQEWEEAVAQVSSYILNKILKKSEKDKEKLAPVTDQDILSQTNLKKLLKQLRIILEKVFFNVREPSTGDGNITRIEEFVEVI